MDGKHASIAGGVVTGLRSRGLLLPAVDFEGSSQLPSVLFTGELAGKLAGRIRVEREAADTRVSVAFWSGSGDGLPGTPEPRWRRLQLPRFAAIEDNYRSQVRDRLAELLSWRSGDGMPGRLALWHGPPGTGKTWALRALGREWNEWCDLHYVTDPERLLGGDTGYMLSVLASRSEPRDDDLDDLLAEGRSRREREDRWRLLVLEDAGEFLGMAAPAEVGRGFARLLNIADGLLGQGTKALILVTTNEPLGKLHPAALRPGRAMAALEFAPLRADEATTWLAERGVARRVDSPKTIAELHAMLAGGQPAGAAAEPDVCRRSGLVISYSMSLSADGYIAGPDGSFDWAAPSGSCTVPQQTGRLDRRPTARPAPLRDDARVGHRGVLQPVMAEFAEIWRPLEKIVFSTTLTSVEGSNRLATGTLKEEIAALGDRRIAVGGAGLAAECMRRGLIDEFELFVIPIVVGGGTPYFPPNMQIDLELVETRTFGATVYLRYRRCG